MKTIFTLCALIICSTSQARQIYNYTELDNHLFYTGDNVGDRIREYMRANNVDPDGMTKLLTANFATNFAKADAKNPGRMIAAKNNIAALRWVSGSAAHDAMIEYSKSEYPEEVRGYAAMCFIARTQTAGLGMISNILTETWRDNNEHNLIRMELYAQAVTSSPADREKYVEFFKWSVMHIYGASALSIDDHLLELDPTWRTNATRKAFSQKLLSENPPEFATGVINGIIRDYELAAGIRKPEPPPVTTQTPQTNIAVAPVVANIATQTNTTTVVAVVSVNSDAFSAVENNTSPSASIAPKRIWIFVAPAILVALAFAVFLHRKK